MKSITRAVLWGCSMLPVLLLAQGSPGGQAMLQSQFVNPCGFDGANEFIILTTGNAPVNINDLAFSSIDPNASTQPNLNFYWRGDDVTQEPNPTLTVNTDVCNTSALECYGIADPDVPAEATVIDARISELNTLAGCNVFAAVPAGGNIPANSNVIFFLGAYNCGFHNPDPNVNFSNHCNGGVPTTTYYAVFGFGDGGGFSMAPCMNPGSGYFSNTESRTSVSYVYNGGGNTNPANYTTNAVPYTPGSPPGSGHAGWIDPSGTWQNTQSCIPTAAQLPITLVAFYGTPNTANIQLHWRTATEQANAWMSIERSKDGIHFFEIGQVKGHGTTLEPQQYQFTDANPFSGINYYRLKQVDTDGAFSYHKMITIVFTGNTQKDNFYIYPSEASDYLNVLFDKELQAESQLFIINLTGQIIQTIKLSAGTLQQTINIMHLHPGHYFITLHSARTFQTARFVKGE